MTGRASPALAAFNAGEWAPQMEGRVDVERYPIATHIQQNFLPLKQGPAMYRAGTASVQQVKQSQYRTWLQRFEFSQTQAFLIEFGNFYCRFYTLHGPLLIVNPPAWGAFTAYSAGTSVIYAGVVYLCLVPSTGVLPFGNPASWYAMTPYQGSNTTAIYEIPSPYAAADLTDSLGEFALKIEQSADVLYIFGGAAGAGPQGLGNGYPPYTLTRVANNPPQWLFAPYAPTDGPFSDLAPLVPGSNVALGVTAAGSVGATVQVLSFGGAPFAPTDVGRLLRIGTQLFNTTPWTGQTNFPPGSYCSNNGNNYYTVAGGVTGESPPVQTSGMQQDGQGGVWWLYVDSGYGVGQISQYVAPNEVKVTVLSRFPVGVIANQANVTAISQANPAVVTCVNSFAEGQPLFLFGVQGMTQVNQQVPVANQAANGANATLAGIDSTSYGAYTGGGEVVANVSLNWQLGSWSFTTEWPRAGAFFKDRLVTAGKLNIWASVPGNYASHAPDQFGQQTTNSAMNELISGADASSVAWLSSAVILLVGTPGGEYGLDSANYSTSPLGPANVEILRQSQWRSRPIRPELVGTTVLYVQRAGRKVFAMDYNFYLNRYDSSDQSKFSYHITIGGITAIAFQQEPWSVLWCTRSDGTLLSYTFNREDQVTAWARHNLGGFGIVESIAVIPSPDGLRDELWMIVNRTVNGQTVRNVEYMVKHYEGPQAGYQGDIQASAWYVDAGVQYLGPSTGNVVGVAVTNPVGDNPGSVTFAVSEVPAVGQMVLVQGVASAGTLNVNRYWQVASVGLGSFTAQLPPNLAGSFSYQGGGTLALSAPGEGVTNIAGIPAVLSGQTVSCLADGTDQGPQVVTAAGTLELVGTFAIVTLGFGYQGNLVPMRPEGGAEVGTAQGKIKQGTDLVLRLVDTGGGQVAQLSNLSDGVYADPLGMTQIVPNNPEPITLTSQPTQLDVGQLVSSGDFPISFPHQAASDQDMRDFYILVQQNRPLPMTVVGLFPQYEVEETR